jgi:hypothetical protein
VEVSLCWKAHCSGLEVDMFVGLSIQSCEGEMTVSNRWDLLLKGKKKTVATLHCGMETAFSKRNIWGVRACVLKLFCQPPPSYSAQTWL